VSDRLSRSAIDKLGDRLRASDRVSDDDLVMLQQVREEYDEVLTDTALRLTTELGLQPGFRLKTVATIVEKLKRERLRLSQMQDIAGIRLVADMNRRQQDALVERVRGAFPNARVFDRRVRPSHGYRAVHLVAQIDGRAIEIQVRTRLQHLWAQVFERAADVYGRQLRYGLPPDDPSLDLGTMSLSEVLELIQEVSEVMGDVEQEAVNILDLNAQANVEVKEVLLALDSTRRRLDGVLHKIAMVLGVGDLEA
jgi:ppGpp synthetase/RelA/SpoT-type nucleotidyltranferase